MPAIVETDEIAADHDCSSIAGPPKSDLVQSPGHPLSPAIRCTPESVPAEIQVAVRRLMSPDPVRFIGQLVLAWAAIFAAIAVAKYCDSLWITVATIGFIATRQNILGLLMHEQCHRLAFRSKLGDLWCNLTAAYPLLMTVEGYRRVHIAHHQNYFSIRDPDYLRKQGSDWTFPQRLSHFARLFLKDILGLSLIHTLRGKEHRSSTRTADANWSAQITRVAYYAVIAIFLTAFDLWMTFFVFWFIPLATIFQMIVRWGAICEHKYNLINPTVPESTPLIEPRWWERMLLPNLNFTLHIYHHWYPRIPFSKLPSVHHLFRNAGLISEEHVFHGYVPYLRSLVQTPAKR